MKPIEETTRSKGMNAEELAAKHLESKGYRVIARNWTAGRLEIDLIATSSSHIVFVEVKSRYSEQYAAPWEAVNSAKRRSVIRAADIYIRQKMIELEPRFDIISVLILPGKESIEHFEGAFFPCA